MSKKVRKDGSKQATKKVGKQESKSAFPLINKNKIVIRK